MNPLKGEVYYLAEVFLCKENILNEKRKEKLEENADLHGMLPAEKKKEIYKFNSNNYLRTVFFSIFSDHLSNLLSFNIQRMFH